MPGDLFIEHGLDALHEWPDAQDAALALLAARRDGRRKHDAEAGGVSAPARNEESHRNGDSAQ